MQLLDKDVQLLHVISRKLLKVTYPIIRLSQKVRNLIHIVLTYQHYHLAVLNCECTDETEQND